MFHSELWRGSFRSWSRFSFKGGDDMTVKSISRSEFDQLLPHYPALESLMVEQGEERHPPSPKHPPSRLTLWRTSRRTRDAG
jgi:hypothetical protein